jgi:cytochrome P450
MTTPSLIELMINRRASSLGVDPFPWYKKMRMTHPVSIDEQNQVCDLFRYRDIQSILSDPMIFSSRRFVDQQGNEQGFSGSIDGMDPPRHKQLRSLFSQAFTPRTIAQQAEHIRDIVNELLDAATASDTLEVIGDLAIPLPVRVIAELLGIPHSQQADFQYWSRIVIGGSLEQAITGLKALEEIVRTSLVQRRKERQSDLISALLAVEGDGELVSEKEIVDFCVALLVAGHETTTSLIGNTILCLDEHPSSREQVWDNPSLLPSAIEEVLRFRSVIQRGSRLVTRDTEIDGKQIKAGYRLFYWSGSANRDEEYFSDPDVFNIRRSPNRHLGFGHGIHFCLGAPLARLEAKIALEQIIERFKDIQRVRDVPLQIIPSTSTYGVQELPVRLQKR